MTTVMANADFDVYVNAATLTAGPAVGIFI